MIFGCNSSLILVHYLSNVHTWAIFFLRHLANMSSMVPSEHQLAPALSPIWARVWSHAIRRRLFIFLMTAAHISPNVFSLRNFLSNVHVLSLIMHSISFILNIHHIRTGNYILLFTWQVHSFISSVLHSRPAALGLSCPIHYGYAQFRSPYSRDRHSFILRILWIRTVSFSVF
jgi:hypothetical protein